MAWVDDIVEALRNLRGEEGYLDEIYKEVVVVRKGNVPAEWRSFTGTVRSTIHRYSSNGGEDDLFFPVDGIGSGIWALNEPVALVRELNRCK